MKNLNKTHVNITLRVMLHPKDWFRRIVNIEFNTIGALVAIKLLFFVLLVETWTESDFENE